MRLAILILGGMDALILLGGIAFNLINSKNSDAMGNALATSYAVIMTLVFFLLVLPSLLLALYSKLLWLALILIILATLLVLMAFMFA